MRASSPAESPALTSGMVLSWTTAGEEDDAGDDMAGAEALGASASDEERVARAGELTTGAQAVGRRAHDEVRDGAHARSKGRETAKACIVMEIATEGAAGGRGERRSGAGLEGYGRRRREDNVDCALGQIDVGGAAELWQIATLRAQKVSGKNFIGLSPHRR